MRLKYAIVELIGDKGKADEIQCGLLRGIGEQDNDKFMWLVTGKKVVRGCSLDHYNILSIVTFDGLTKTYTFFMADDDEQAEAFEVVEAAYEDLKGIALVEGGTLLDVSKFEDVPEDFGKITSTPKQQSVSKFPAKSPTNTTSGVNRYYNDFNRDPEPYPWKRKTKKPTKKTLEALRTKLALIAKKEYEFTACEIKGEIDARKEKDSEATAMADTDTDPYDKDDLPFCGSC